MTEEEIKALQDELAATKAAKDEAIARATKAEADKAGLVEEVKTERQKKQEALDKAKLNGGELDVNSLIEQALTEKETARRKAELESAIAEFKNSKSEFQTDAAGIVFGKFTEHLKKFNLSDLSSKDEAKARLEEIYRFVNFKENDNSNVDYEGTPQGGSVPAVKDGQIKADVKSAMEFSGVSPERFKQLKEKYPDQFNSLEL